MNYRLFRISSGIFAVSYFLINASGPISDQHPRLNVTSAVFFNKWPHRFKPGALIECADTKMRSVGEFPLRIKGTSKSAGTLDEVGFDAESCCL